MPYYSVTDFNLPYPAWPRPLRRIRRGAMTAFVDRESGELVAGYSYTTCLFVVAISGEHPRGRLYENLTRYSVTTSGQHSWALREMISKQYTGEYDFDWQDGRCVETTRVAPIAPVAEAIDVPQGTSAAELVVRCDNPIPVDLCVRARAARVDAYNAAIDDGRDEYYAQTCGDGAYRIVVDSYRDRLAALLGRAHRDERLVSDAFYGCELARSRRRRALAEERAERRAEKRAAEATPVLAQAEGLPPGSFMLDGKLYGKA